MRDFLAALSDLLGPERLDHYTPQLAELCQEVTSQRKGGELTLKIKLTPNGENAMKAASTLTTKCPPPTFGERIVYTTANGDILREDPRQEKMPFETIHGDKTGA